MNNQTSKLKDIFRSLVFPKKINRVNSCNSKKILARVDLECAACFGKSIHNIHEVNGSIQCSHYDVAYPIEVQEYIAFREIIEYPDLDRETFRKIMADFLVKCFSSIQLSSYPYILIANEGEGIYSNISVRMYKTESLYQEDSSRQYQIATKINYYGGKTKPLVESMGRGDLWVS